jgi:hypothetical protein
MEGGREGRREGKGEEKRKEEVRKEEGKILLISDTTFKRFFPCVKKLSHLASL